jgi:uncharacterized protein (TIGR02646 family)
MIPVAAQPEPALFDASVRQPGKRWLIKNKVSITQPPPAKTNLSPYWRACLDDLHTSYAGVCAYLCVFVERTVGGTSVDHFVAKSKAAGRAYEWDNYRLACSTMNARKRDYDTVLDPFTLAANTFHLELVTGRIYPNPTLPKMTQTRAEKTIGRLGLDDGGCREIRARRYSDYIAIRGASPNLACEAHLKRYTPFVWYEAHRQGVL